MAAQNKMAMGCRQCRRQHTQSKKDQGNKDDTQNRHPDIGRCGECLAKAHKAVGSRLLWAGVEAAAAAVAEAAVAMAVAAAMATAEAMDLAEAAKGSVAVGVATAAAEAVGMAGAWAGTVDLLGTLRRILKAYTTLAGCRSVHTLQNPRTLECRHN